MAFYAVARGKNPGVYYTWEECIKEVSGFPGALHKKFTREKEAWDFVKGNCPNVKLTAGSSPVKRKLSTDCIEVGEVNDNNMKVKVMERLQGLQEKLKIFYDSVTKEIQQFNDNIVNEINSIKEEFAENLPQPPRKAILIDVSDAPIPNTERAFSHLPCTSGNRFGEPVSSAVEDDTISTFRVDADGYVEVYTDGACSSNGYSGAKAGVGVWFGDGHSLNLSEPVRGRLTNNCAEIEAATMAIESAKLAGVRKLKVYTDSEFLIRAITTWIKKWKKNNWKTTNGLAVKNKEELIILDQVLQSIDVKFIHVKGHVGIYENEQADALARAGAEKCIPKNRR